MSKIKQIPFAQKWQKKQDAKHRVLYVPDQVSKEMYESIDKRARNP